MRSLPLRLYAFLLLGLAACSPLKELRNLHEKADDGSYHSNLAAEYLSFAEAEMEMGHEETADFFAEKGIRAAKRQAAEPEKPQSWNITGNELNTLTKARERLVNVQGDFHTKVASHIVARSQLYYDCWVVDTAGKRKNSEIASCKDEFLAEVKRLESIEKAYLKKDIPSLPKQFDIHFGLGNDKLDKNAYYTISLTTNLAAIYPDSVLFITGHTDRTGSHGRNMQVAQARANNVAEALIERGIDPTRITIAAKGSADLRVPTLEGYSRKQNRRVEILIHEKHADKEEEAEKAEESEEQP